MGLPIFFLGLLSIFAFINQPEESITPSFYIGATLILAIMIYFFLYMIYRGFDERVTDPITHTFTREYLYKLLKKEILKENSILNARDVSFPIRCRNLLLKIFSERKWILTGKDVLKSYSHQVLLGNPKE